MTPSLPKEAVPRKPETIEVRNETRRVILASACRSKLSGKLYVHIGIGKALGDEVKIGSNYYGIVEVQEVDF